MFFRNSCSTWSRHLHLSRAAKQVTTVKRKGLWRKKGRGEQVVVIQRKEDFDRGAHKIGRRTVLCTSCRLLFLSLCHEGRRVIPLLYKERMITDQLCRRNNYLLLYYFIAALFFVYRLLTFSKDTTLRSSSDNYR